MKLSPDLLLIAVSVQKPLEAQKCGILHSDPALKLDTETRRQDCSRNWCLLLNRMRQYFKHKARSVFCGTSATSLFP